MLRDDYIIADWMRVKDKVGRSGPERHFAPLPDVPPPKAIKEVREKKPSPQEGP